MKKRTSLILVIMMMCSIVFIGCDKEGVELLEGVKNFQKTTSNEVDSNISVKIDMIESDDNSVSVPGYYPMNIQVSGKSKFVGRAGGAKEELDLKINVMDLSTYFRMYCETNIKDEKVNRDCYVDIPQFLKNYLGLGKLESKYLYFGSDDFEGDVESTEELVERVNKELDSLEIFKNKFNDVKIAKNLGYEKHEINGINENLKMFEVKVTKEHIKAIIDELLDDKDNVIKVYELIYSSYPEESKNEVIEALKADIKASTEVLKSLADQYLNLIDDSSNIIVKVGMKNGYIAYVNGSADIKLTNGIIVNIKSENKIYNINKEVIVDMPKFDNKNSVNAMKYLNEKWEKEAKAEEELLEEEKFDDIDVSKYINKRNGTKLIYKFTNTNDTLEITNEIVKDGFVQQRIKDSIGEYSTLYMINKDSIEAVNAYYYKENEKVKDLTKLKFDDKYKCTILKNPAIENEWIGSENEYSYVAYLDSIVTTPAGRFTTLEVWVEYEDGTYGELYYAEGIGLVKAIRYDENMDTTVTYLQSIIEN